jgi:hypothetical protein
LHHPCGLRCHALPVLRPAYCPAFARRTLP